MNPPPIPERLFPSAQIDARLGNAPTPGPQTEHPAYRLAFQDPDFLLREDLRPVRFQLELLKSEVLLAEAGIASTFVFYGSARIPSPEAAPALVAAADTPEQQAVARRLAAKAHYYDVARQLAGIVSTYCQDGARCFTVCSGGGPSIMEAANRGAWEAGAPSIGLNIVLPHEQVPNPYVTPGLSVQFHYFALRKMHFLMRAKAVAAFPGGFGTFDELFELLTLVQTGKVAPMPILIYGQDFWRRVVDFEALADEGVISRDDLKLFHFVETAEEGWAIVKAHYRL
jgi:hypothetical protein